MLHYGEETQVTLEINIQLLNEQLFTRIYSDSYDNFLGWQSVYCYNLTDYFKSMLQK